MSRRQAQNFVDKYAAIIREVGSEFVASPEKSATRDINGFTIRICMDILPVDLRTYSVPKAIAVSVWKETERVAFAYTDAKTGKIGNGLWQKSLAPLCKEIWLAHKLSV